MYQNIPANIITGFLGAGKTTAIQYLLSQKPEGERWAVLVNEFGEVGIDASLMSDSAATGQVFITEVPGGCMCCSAGLPMSIALNQLIRKASPDRLLIEPTGLGHPDEVIATLLQPEYREVLDLRATLTLVDARKLADTRYREHRIFQQQLQVADRVIASKADLYAADEHADLQSFLQSLDVQVPVSPVSDGRIEQHWLNADNGHRAAQLAGHHHHHGETSGAFATDEALPAAGYLRKDNQGQGYFSAGWVFSPEFEFQFAALEGLLNGLDVERMKAVFITDEGIFAFNLADGVLSVKPLDEVWDSRIEVIGPDVSAWEPLEACLLQISDRL